MGERKLMEWIVAVWNFSFNLGEINKHMQDLTAEFEELFDPYLPIASKLKIKPGMGVSAKVKLLVQL